MPSEQTDELTKIPTEDRTSTGKHSEQKPFPKYESHCHGAPVIIQKDEQFKYICSTCLEPCVARKKKRWANTARRKSAFARIVRPDKFPMTGTPVYGCHCSCHVPQSNKEPEDSLLPDQIEPSEDDASSIAYSKQKPLDNPNPNVNKTSDSVDIPPSYEALRAQIRNAMQCEDEEQLKDDTGESCYECQVDKVFTLVQAYASDRERAGIEIHDIKRQIDMLDVQCKEGTCPNCDRKYPRLKELKQRLAELQASEGEDNG